jgi:hypothetical protein
MVVCADEEVGCKLPAQRSTKMPRRAHPTECLYGKVHGLFPSLQYTYHPSQKTFSHPAAYRRSSRSAMACVNVLKWADAPKKLKRFPSFAPPSLIS